MAFKKKFFSPLFAVSFATSMVFAATTFGGCQIFSNKAPAEQGSIDHVPQDRRIGVIQSLGGVNTSTQGTDILTMDDGSTILLRSVAINLDDPKYLTNKVEVSGVLTYTTDGKQLMEVQSIDVLESTPTTQQVVAVTWRDYVNAAMGFQMQYRDDFKADESAGIIAFTRAIAPDALLVMADGTQESAAAASSAGGVTASTVSIATEHKITIAVKTLGSNASETPTGLLAAGYSKSRIGADGIEAYKKLIDDGKSVNFAFNDGVNFYQISYSGGSDSQTLEDQNVFYQMLASFKLLNPSSALTQQAVIKDVPATAVVPQTQAVAPAPKVALPEAVTTPTAAVTPPTTPVAAAPVTPPSAAPAPASSPSDASGTQQTLAGYSVFASTGYKFTIQYPKGWYFGQSTTTDAGVLRRYNFGSKPVDELPGDVNLDIGTGLTGGFSFTGKNGRVYRLSGPANMSNVLQAMIGTIREQ